MTDGVPLARAIARADFYGKRRDGSDAQFCQSATPFESTVGIPGHGAWTHVKTQVPSTLARICDAFISQRQAEGDDTWNAQSALDAYIAGDARYRREVHVLAVANEEVNPTR